jgi:hypothetical protein
MQKHFVLSLCVVSALLILSCAKSEPEAGTNKTAEVKPATTSTPSLTASSSTRIGVPECDDFIVKYDACVSNKVPAYKRRAKDFLDELVWMSRALKWPDELHPCV